MTMYRIVIVGTIVLVTSQATLGADVNVQAGRAALTKGEIWAALEIFIPCLKTPLADKSAQADCLYLGNQAADAVTDAMTRTGCQGTDIATARRMGLNVTREYMYETYCAHDGAFLKKLRTDLPYSAYRDEVEWLFRGGCDVYEKLGWRECESANLNYIKAFPRSEYAAMAKYDLARIYDNAWQYLHEGHATELVGSGDPAKDAVLAETLRLQALLLYRKLLESDFRPMRHTRRFFAIRYQTLSAKIPDNVFDGISIH